MAGGRVTGALQAAGRACANAGRQEARRHKTGGDSAAAGQREQNLTEGPGRDRCAEYGSHVRTGDLLEIRCGLLSGEK